MDLAAKLFWVPWLALVVGLAFALAGWLGARFPRLAPAGWKRWVIRGDVALILLPLAWVGWRDSIAQLTEGSYRCVVCGRSELQVAFCGLRLHTKVRESGDAYSARFAEVLPSAHAHAWSPSGCILSGEGVFCHYDVGYEWFRDLPRLADAAAADELVREANGLDDRALFDLRLDFAHEVSFARGGEPLDAAFASWRARRAERRPIELEVWARTQDFQPIPGVWFVGLERGAETEAFAQRADERGVATLRASERSVLRLEVWDRERERCLLDEDVYVLARGRAYHFAIDSR
ncbi:MAG: hypothetical protein IT453_19400 [Planctomycetes bacterium]|nr:hypothetical protein [Planctomycetota bacterium]